MLLVCERGTALFSISSRSNERKAGQLGIASSPFRQLVPSARQVCARTNVGRICVSGSLKTRE